MAEALGLDRSQRGIAIGEVVAGGPADSAGIQSADPATGRGGDVIIGVDKQEVRAFDDLLGYIVEDTRVGQTIDLLVLRDGQELTVSVTLGQRPTS
jgi:S1-C subfamily serine protease